MASVYDKYYEQQPPMVKIIVVAGLGLLGYSLYRSIKRARDLRDAQQSAQAAVTEIEMYAQQGYEASYTDSEYYGFVDALVQAMNGCGTDEEKILEVFRKMRNPVDIRRLIIAFGVQYYQPCSVTEFIEYLRWQVDRKAYGGDLATWLNFDLSASYIADINQILSARATDYQF